MANEITVSGAVVLFKKGVTPQPVGLNFDGLTFTMSGNVFVGPTTVSVTSSAPIAINMGQVSSPHWAIFVNVDLNNFISLMSSAVGAPYAQLYPGEFAILPLRPISTPYAQADTAAAFLQYMIISS